MSHGPLLAEPLDIDAIMTEHAASEARVVAESTPFHEAVAALRHANRCDVCGKTRTVINIAPRRGIHHQWKDEPVSPATHCACPDGPAYVAPSTDAIDIVFAPSVTVETISRLFYAANGGGWIEPGVRGVVVNIETHRRIATLLFEGHDAPYLMNVRDLRARVKAVAA